jgi:hypothetical protein
MNDKAKNIMFVCISFFFVVCSLIALSFWFRDLSKTATETITSMRSIEHQVPGTDIVVKDMTIKWINNTLYYSFTANSKQQDARQKLNSLRFRFYDTWGINVCDAAYVTRIIGVTTDGKKTERYDGEGKIDNVSKEVFREIRHYSFLF